MLSTMMCAYNDEFDELKMRIISNHFNTQTVDPFQFQLIHKSIFTVASFKNFLLIFNFCAFYSFWQTQKLNETNFFQILCSNQSLR